MSTTKYDAIIEQIMLSLIDNYSSDKDNWKLNKAYNKTSFAFELSLDIDGDDSPDGSVKMYYNFNEDFSLDISYLTFKFDGMIDSLQATSWCLGSKRDEVAYDLSQVIYEDKLKFKIKSLQSTDTNMEILTKLANKVGKKRRRTEKLDSLLTESTPKISKTNPEKQKKSWWQKIM